MRILIRFFVACLILCMSATVLAEGFEMNKVSLNTRKEDGCDQENWLAASARAKYDLLDLRLRAKLYFPQLSENWEDTSKDDGMGDKYSGIRADMGFPGISKGLEAALAHKWNENYTINLAGLGYNLSPIDDLTLGLWCEVAKAESSNDSYYDYDRQKQQFSLSYTPDPWGYSLVVTRQDKKIKNFTPGPDSDNPAFNNDYSYLKYSYEHQLTWQASSKLKLGLGYATSNADYYNDDAKKDGTSDEWKLKANYKQNDYWTWDGSYSTWDCDGYNDWHKGNMLAIDATYSPEKSWSLTPKLRIADLDYSDKYRAAYDDPEDKNADYHSRQYQAVALAYEKKYDKWAYDIEGFVKNYDYDESGPNIPDDNISTGAMLTVTWQTGQIHWYVQVAPQGSLTTRNGYYEARAEYRF
jgi:hypothetical protein